MLKSLALILEQTYPALVRAALQKKLNIRHNGDDQG